VSALIIAIDGPSAAGKSTLAKRLAKDLGFTYLDTGAMYRALALKVLSEGIDISNDAALPELINRTEIDLAETGGKLKVLLDGQDVSDTRGQPNGVKNFSAEGGAPLDVGITAGLGKTRECRGGGQRYRHGGVPRC
jgi:CMP/dCMP kinase